jgi:homopolymeric O-antigen transport system permease protein
VASTYELVIKPRKGWQPVDLREIWSYRELLGFLVWRDIKVRYKQTLLGGLWAIIQPLVGMLVFGVLFNRVAAVQSDGSPYPLFVFTGLTIWSFFQNGVSLSSNSLIGNDEMIRRIYFPRIIVPLAQILALLLDLAISFLFLAVLMVYYHWRLSSNVVWLPFFLVGSCLATAGFGFILSTLNVRYRDVKYALPFFTQMLLFITPVLYPISHVPGKLRVFLSLNPMAGMVEGCRYALLGSPVSWHLMLTSFIGAIVMFVVGLFFVRRMEISFADVI